jgi:hypothetical protein
MKRVSEASLTKLEDMRAHHQLVHNRSVALSSLLGSTVRAAELALWRAEDLHEHAGVAQHLHTALAALDAAATALKIPPTISHAEDIRQLYKETS